MIMRAWGLRRAADLAGALVELDNAVVADEVNLSDRKEGVMRKGMIWTRDFRTQVCVQFLVPTNADQK